MIRLFSHPLGSNFIMNSRKRIFWTKIWILSSSSMQGLPSLNTSKQQRFLKWLEGFTCHLMLWFIVLQKLGFLNRIDLLFIVCFTVPSHEKTLRASWTWRESIVIQAKDELCCARFTLSTSTFRNNLLTCERFGSLLRFKCQGGAYDQHVFNLVSGLCI